MKLPKFFRESGKIELSKQSTKFSLFSNKDIRNDLLFAFHRYNMSQDLRYSPFPSRRSNPTIRRKLNGQQYLDIQATKGGVQERVPRGDRDSQLPEHGDNLRHTPNKHVQPSVIDATIDGLQSDDEVTQITNAIRDFLDPAYATLDQQILLLLGVFRVYTYWSLFPQEMKLPNILIKNKGENEMP